MILVSAVLVFANQEDRDHAVELTAPIQLATRTEEKGCESYCFAPDPSVPNHIQVYERWDSEKDLELHFQHPTYAKMVAALGTCNIVESRNRMYAVSNDQTVYHEDGSPRTVPFFGD
jgi:quinol monooxygenase YgiN